MSAQASTAADRPSRELVRVGFYYVVFFAIVFALFRYVPVVREAISGGSLSGIGGPGAAEVFGAGAAPPVGALLGGTAWHNAVVATISMMGALAIMMPVTWVYMLTRGRRGYEESVVHTLLILPVTVTGIVMIVKSSVALAFSLAGIVAAVRFRTTLDDTKDAVYVFLAIGVGLASGVQAVGVAFALSMIFNLVVLVLWRTRFGDALESREALVSVGGAGAPAPDPLSLGEDRAAGLHWHIAAERDKGKGKRANSLVVIHAKTVEPAQAFVEARLGEIATKWKLAEIVPAGGGFTLSYVVRLEGTAGQGALMDRLRQGVGGDIDGAELRSLKGLGPRP
jgi:hypothetical protein